MAKQAWICGICFSPFEGRQWAEGCERSHKPIDKAWIQSANFRRENAYPEFITVAFSKQSGDFAIYRLDHVGTNRQR